MSEETVIAENKSSKKPSKNKRPKKVSFRKQLNFVYL